MNKNYKVPTGQCVDTYDTIYCVTDMEDKHIITIIW